MMRLASAAGAVAADAVRHASQLCAHPNSPDQGGLAEFSVVYTDRATNHMSAKFQSTMRNLNSWLTEAYRAEASVVIPGSGTTGMEAVARQFANGQKVLVVRNGLFSYRWSQIFDVGRIPSDQVVLKARRVGEGDQAPFQPAPIGEVVATIRAEKPAVVFAPHVETSSGIILPSDYVKAVADAAHEAGGIFVLDGIASGCAWVDMKALGVDVYVTAPQKGWSGPACAGIVMLGERGLEQLGKTQSSSFALDLSKWHAVMQAYVKGGHMYHATMPTDALIAFENVMREARERFGLEKLEAAQWELGRRTVQVLESHGAKIVAAEGFRSPGVVVAYTTRDDCQSGLAFKQQGMQIAGGVPLFVDEGPAFKTFRLGMLGIEKLADVDGTIAKLETVLGAIGPL